MSPAALPLSTSPAPRPDAGVCRICGCTDAEACWVVTYDTEAGAVLPLVTCGWVDESLCSRCWSPRRPTMRQAGELARIADRHGPVRVSRGRGSFELELALIGGTDLGKHFVVRPAVLTLDADGRIVHRLAREVIPTGTVAATTGGEETGSWNATPQPAPHPTSSESYEQLDRLHSRWRSV